MRKLLVASQKGGVGKTTTSINVAATTAAAGARVLLFDADPLSSISSSLHLAQHARRQTLRQLGLDLPGVLVSDVIPGLDVLSPYEDGGCTDDDLDQLLALPTTRPFQDGYGCLIVDTPPFLGPNPTQLLQTCDEFILVMRSEPLAYRTLPAFLELVQRSRGDGPGIKMRGILLTLPEGEEVGGRWERELRGRFGTRILTNVIPHDEAVPQAVLFGNIVSHSHQEAPASLAYRALVENLELARDGHDTIERTSAAATLVQAFAAVKAPRRPASRVAPPLPAVAPSSPAPPAPVLALAEPTPVEKPACALAAVERESVVVWSELPPSRRDFPRPTGVATNPEAPVAETPPAKTPPAKTPPAMPRQPAPRPVTPPRKAPAPASLRGADRDSVPGGKFPVGMGVLWVGLATMVGVGLRLLRLPDNLVPILIGVGVGVIVVVALRYLQKQEQGSPPAPVRKPSRRAEGRPDPAKRLSGLKRRVTMPARNVRDS